MTKRFNTVQEVQRWRTFILKNETYDLSHLDAHEVEYFDQKKQDVLIKYKFIVTYGLHCFTKTTSDLSQDDSQLWMYSGPNESRHFNLERYSLSKHLPSIIKALGNRETLVFHAGYENFAAVKTVTPQGIAINYFVVFKAFREKRKLRIHIASAYPKDKLGKIRKINFFAIARNLYRGKKPPKPSQ